MPKIYKTGKVWPLIARYLVLCLIACLISLVFLEYGLRLATYSKKLFKKLTVPSYEVYEGNNKLYDTYRHPPLVKYNSFLGFVPIENIKTPVYQTNQYGFRYRDNFPIKKPSREIRIFFTGGSTAWGIGVSQEDLYTTRLERDLQSRFPDYKIRCICAAIPAQVSTNERIIVQNKIIAFNPDIVVMFTGFNDTLAGYYGISVLDNWDRLKAAPILAKHSRLYATSKEEVKDLRPPLPEDYSFKTRYFVSKLLYIMKYSRDLKTMIKELMLDPELVAKGLTTNATGVYDISKRYNFKLIFYLQPSIYDTKKVLTPYEKLTTNQTIYNTGFPEYTSIVYGKYRKDISKIASQEGFYFFDGDEAISGETKTVFADECHFGDRGNRLIAEDLTRIISKIINGLK